MPTPDDALDAKIDNLEQVRAGRLLSATEAAGLAADDAWGNARDAIARARRPHLGELAEIQRLRTRLAHAENFCALMADHLKGCRATPDEDAALREWHYAAGIQEIAEDDSLRSEL